MDQLSGLEAQFDNMDGTAKELRQFHCVVLSGSVESEIDQLHRRWNQLHIGCIDRRRAVQDLLSDYDINGSGDLAGKDRSSLIVLLLCFANSRYFLPLGVFHGTWYMVYIRTSNCNCCQACSAYGPMLDHSACNKRYGVSKGRQSANSHAKFRLLGKLLKPE